MNVYAVIGGESTAQCQQDAAGSLGSSDGATATAIDPSVITQPASCTVTDPSEPGVSIKLYPVSAGDTTATQLVCSFAQSAAGGSTSTTAVVHHRPQHEHVNTEMLP